MPVPYPNGLVVGTGDDPWQLMVEENGSHIIQMSVQSEKTAPRLIRPYFDLVVVASRDEERLGLVEIDTSNRPVVFFETVNESTHTVVPKLNSRGMEGDEDPWPRILGGRVSIIVGAG